MPNLFPQLYSLKNLKYIQYSCVFQTLRQGTVLRPVETHPLLRNYSIRRAQMQRKSEHLD